MERGSSSRKLYRRSSCSVCRSARRSLAHNEEEISVDNVTNIENVTYNWFIKGGLSSYQDMFLLSEKEPLYEYGMLGVLLLIPVSTHLSMKRKAEVILLKVAIFHIISSLLLMDWNNLIVNYNFRKVK